MSPTTHVPMEFLLTASKCSLMDFELSRLNHAALLQKRLRDTLHEIAEEMAQAMLARIFIENEGLRGIGRDPLQETFNFAGETLRDEPGGVFPRHGEAKRAFVDAADAA